MNVIKKGITPILTLLILLLCSSSVPASTVKYYKYSSWYKNYIPNYKVEITPSRNRERYYKVSYDSRGRVKSSEYFRNGEGRGRVEYIYKGSNKYYSTSISYSKNGQQERKAQRKHNANGDLIRTDTYTMSGERTSYSIRTNFPGGYKIVVYNNDGSEYSTSEAYFNDYGTIYKSVSYGKYNKRNTKFINYINPETGQIYQTDGILDGKPWGTKKIFYNDFGSVIKSEVYNQDNSIRSYQKYEKGLKIETKNYAAKKLFKMQYNENRRRVATELYYRDIFVCTFRYIYYDNGEIRKTIAQNKNNEPIAEYPNRRITNVNRDGRPYDGKEATIHTNRNWY